MLNIDFEAFIAKEYILNAAKQNLRGTDDSIGLHIRRSDNQKSIENSPIDLFVEAIDEELKVNEKQKFYLATDSEDVEKELKNKYPNNILLMENKDRSRNSEKGMIDALIDLTALSYCKKIYGSYWSSFSDTAGVWNGKKELHILKKKM